MHPCPNMITWAFSHRPLHQSSNNYSNSSCPTIRAAAWRICHWRQSARSHRNSRNSRATKRSRSWRRCSSDDSCSFLLRAFSLLCRWCLIVDLCLGTNYIQSFLYLKVSLNGFNSRPWILESQNTTSTSKRYSGGLVSCFS